MQVCEFETELQDFADEQSRLLFRVQELEKERDAGLWQQFQNDRLQVPNASICITDVVEIVDSQSNIISRVTNASMSESCVLKVNFVWSIQITYVPFTTYGRCAMLVQILC